MAKKHNVRKKQRLVLAINCIADGQTREVLRGFVKPYATVGEIGDVIDALNKVYEGVKFEMNPIWEEVA